MGGRYIVCKITLNDHTLCLVNIYAPNENKPEFFVELFEIIREMECTHIVCGGDFNVAMNSELDRSIDKKYNKLNWQEIKKGVDEFELNDIWRIRNPDSKCYTWMKGRDKLSWSRIDYFLISSTLCNMCVETDIVPSIQTDHSMISITLSFIDCKRGPGTWKFNNSFLSDEKFCDKMQMVLETTASNYHYLNGIDRWELLKFEAIRTAQEYASDIAGKKKSRKFMKYKQLSRLQQESLKNNDHDGILREIKKVTADIDAYETLDAMKAAFRCRKEYVQKGEVSSKYFFGLEKRNYVAKTMYVAKRSDGTLTKDYREILNLQFDFYQDLYTSDKRTKFDVKNNSGILLSSTDKWKFEEMVSKGELFDAAMTLKSGCTPGPDGLSIEFYRKFWKKLVDPLYDMYCEALVMGKLNPSGRRGIINLLPKRNRNELFVRNWRPIVLLCNDYKIWAKAIANRLECVSEELIGKQQYGFVKNRSIFGNIRRTVEIAAYLHKRNLEGIIVQIDFEKCFDRVEFDAIRNVFRYFGFGEKFVEMLMVLYSEFQLCTTNNGFTSKFLKKGRGTNQGCPASPLVYTFCGEIMAHLVKENRDIHGISLHNIENILAQFADDTSAYLQYTNICLNAFLNTLSRVENTMGLKVSYEKTTVYRMGSLKNSNATLYTQKRIQWSDGPIEVLGVKINCDGVSPCRENFTDIMQKVETVCQNWYNRTLTIFGKVLVINSLIGSLFMYRLSTVLDLSRQDIHSVEMCMREFIWKGKKPKIALYTLTKNKHQGGIRLVDITAKQDSIRIGWIFRLEKDLFLQECAFAEIAPTLRNLIWSCNLSQDCIRKMFDVNNLWVQILISWSKINYKEPKCFKYFLRIVAFSSMSLCIEETKYY